jgi:hypothetical protein
MSDDPIDQVNRFAIAVVALVVVFVALAAILLAWGAPESTISRVADFSGWLRRHNDTETKVIITLSASVVAFFMLTVMILELTPSSSRRMRVRNVKSGEAAITTTEIARRVSHEVRQISHIADCQAIVAARGRRVEIVLDLQLGAGANLADTADEACRCVQVLVEQHLGIELAQPPRARLHYRELRLGGVPPGLAASGDAVNITSHE